LLLGFLSLPALAAGATSLWFALPKGLIQAPPAAELAIVGADVSGAKGTTLMVKRWDDVIRQDCREGCDDLDFRDTRGGPLNVQTLNAKGECIVCSAQTEWAGDGVRNSWSLSGRPRLQLSRRARNG